VLKYEINDEGCLEVDQVIKDLHLSPKQLNSILSDWDMIWVYVESINLHHTMQIGFFIN
jgi:hypothetical protein